MSIIKKTLRFFTDSEYRFLIYADKGKFDNMQDSEYLTKRFKAKLGYPLNLENPITFNEKLQWLKLHDRRPEYTTMVDKHAVKKYVAETIGEQYIIPTLGVWERFEDIDFDKLPNQFVLKCTHDSGGLVICKDKSTFDKRKAKKKIKKSLKRNYYYIGREWPYKDVKPRILAEKYMEDNSGGDLKDYKFFCFNGKVRFLYVSEGLSNHQTARISYVTLDWKQAQFFREDYSPFEKLPSKPINFEKMIEFAELLSMGIPFLRVDFYEINGCIYFGELTLCTGAGFTKFVPEEWDRKLGELICLPNEEVY